MEWHPLSALAKLLPASRDELVSSELSLDDLTEEKSVEVAEEKLGGVIKLDLVSHANNPATAITVNVPKPRPVDKPAKPTVGSFSTDVDLVKEAEAAVALNTTVVDPFSDAAVASRIGTNDRWVLSEPAEQGEINFGRQAWGFVDPESQGPGPIVLSFEDVSNFMTGIEDAKGDTDEDGHRITPEITDATGPSPAGSTFYRDALQCKRRMAFRYYFGLVPKVEAPWLLAGTVIHRALAYYWANQMAEPPSWHQPDMYALEAELLRLAPHDPNLVRDSLTIMLEHERYYATGGYLNPHERRRRVRQDREWVPFSVEQIYSCCIDDVDPPNLIDEQVEKGLRLPPSAAEMSVGKALLTIRPDIVVSPIARPNRLVLVDHKTEGDDWTGSFKKKSLKVWEGDDKYSTHFQFFVYLHVLQFLFGKDRVQREPVVQRVRRTAPFQMHRHEVLTNAAMLFENTPAVLRKGAAEAMLAKEQAKKTIWLDPGSMPCYAPWPCQYLPICESKTDAIANAVIAGKFMRLSV